MLYTLWDGTASSPLHKVPASEPPKLKDSPHLQNITALVSNTHHFFSVFLPGEGFHRVSIFDGLFPHGTIRQMTSSNSPVSPTTLIRKTFIRCIQQRLLTHQAPNCFSKRCHKTQYFQVTPPRNTTGKDWWQLCATWDSSPPASRDQQTPTEKGHPHRGARPHQCVHPERHSDRTPFLIQRGSL